MDGSVKTLVDNRALKSSSTAAYVGEVSSALAELARRHDLDFLAYLLEMAALEAQSDVEGVAGSASNLGRLSATQRGPSSAKRQIELLPTSFFVKKIDEANEHLEKAAKMADEAVQERRRNLRDIDRLERKIGRAQAKNSRLLERLIKAA